MNIPGYRGRKICFECDVDDQNVDLDYPFHLTRKGMTFYNSIYKGIEDGVYKKTKDQARFGVSINDVIILFSALKCSLQKFWQQKNVYFNMILKYNVPHYSKTSLSKMKVFVQKP